MASRKVKEAVLSDFINWSGGSEIDLYPYVKSFFTKILGYPSKKVKLCERMGSNVPDIVLSAKDSDQEWLVGEIKPVGGLFRVQANKNKVITEQLSRYITADTVFGLLIDPTTIVILYPDLKNEVKTIELDDNSATIEDLTSETHPNSLLQISFEQSESKYSLIPFREGILATGYLDVDTKEGAKLLRKALRISASELSDYARAQIKKHREKYDDLKKVVSKTDEDFISSTPEIQELRFQGRDSIRMVEEILPAFASQIGREIKDEKFLNRVFAVETASLVLSRILFVRYAEDYELVSRKISNGGIPAFRAFYTNIKEDYSWLLKCAFQDGKAIYSNLFEESIFDWAQETDGQLASLLERIFFRLNAFDFKKVTADILGNLYATFLSRKDRKNLGEYYTPRQVARYLLKACKFQEHMDKLIDPACGSGSFLIEALQQSIEEQIKRGTVEQAAISGAIDLVCGLDINVFASFIAQLQTLWTLFPYIKPKIGEEFPRLNIYGGLNSLEARKRLLTLEESLIPKELEHKAIKIRDSKYSFVVGNPPYVRNERLKVSGPWREYYGLVSYRNADLAFFFVQRALEGGIKGGPLPDRFPPWLIEGGILGFVLSVGFANSKAGLKMRKLLYSHTIIEVVDLEFVAAKLFDADIVPMLLIVKKGQPPKDHKVRIRIPDPNRISLEDFELDETSEDFEVPQVLFRIENAVNEMGDGTIDNNENESQHPTDEAGISFRRINPFEYLLTKVREDDIPLLTKLFSTDLTLEDCSTEIKYGMKLGRECEIKTTQEDGTFPIYKGSDVATFYFDPSESDGFVNPSDAEDSSIWQENSVPEKAYVIPAIIVSLTTAAFDPREIVFNNSVIIFVPKTDPPIENISLNSWHGFPWDAFLHSSVVRFLFLALFRSAVLLRRRFTVYPRAIKKIPVPSQLFDTDIVEKIKAHHVPLIQLAEEIKNRWRVVENEIDRANKAPLSTFDIEFRDFEEKVFGKVELEVHSESNSNCILWIGKKAMLEDDFSLDDEEEDGEVIASLIGSYELLNVVSFMLGDKIERNIPLVDFQQISIPVKTEIERISQLIDEASGKDETKRNEFLDHLKKIDEAIEEAFGLNKNEREMLHSRLNNFPFTRLIPRYPWEEGAHHQVTRRYVTDRFA